MSHSYKYKIFFIAGNSCSYSVLHSSNVDLGLKGVLENPDVEKTVIRNHFSEALNIVKATAASQYYRHIGERVVSRASCINTMPMEESVLKIIKRYGEKIILKESDKKPKASKKKGRKRSSMAAVSREKQSENNDDWQGPPPWDTSLGGDGCPKFLCDVMVNTSLPPAAQKIDMY